MLFFVNCQSIYHFHLYCEATSGSLHTMLVIFLFDFHFKCSFMSAFSNIFMPNLYFWQQPFFFSFWRLVSVKLAPQKKNWIKTNHQVKTDKICLSDKKNSEQVQWQLLGGWVNLLCQNVHLCGKVPANRAPWRLDDGAVWKFIFHILHLRGYLFVWMIRLGRIFYKLLLKRLKGCYHAKKNTCLVDRKSTFALNYATDWGKLNANCISRQGNP